MNKRIYIIIILVCLVAGVAVSFALWGSRSSGGGQKIIESNSEMPDPAEAVLPDQYWLDNIKNDKLPNVDVSRLPDLPVGHDDKFPSPGEMAQYLIVIGFRTPITDDQATWVLRVNQVHPDYNVRLAAIRDMGSFFSGGGRNQGAKSRVSRALRDQATSVILQGLASKDDNERHAFASTVGVNRLWLLYPEFKDAFVRLKDDPDIYINDFVNQAITNRKLSGYIILE